VSKISELSDGGSLISSDYLIAVRSGGNVKVRMDQINVDQVDLGDIEFIRLGNSQDLTMVHNATNSIINQAGIGDLLLQKAGATKLTINASGIDVTGSVTASGPIVLTAGALAAAGNAGLSHRSTDNKVYLQAGTGGFNILDDQQNTHFAIDSAGVSSFYNNVGIGTSLPSAAIHATTATAGYTAKFINTNGASDANGLLIQAGTVGSEYALNVANTAGTTNFMVVKGDGSVGIGTSSPNSYDSRANNLVVGDSGDAGVTIFSGASSNARLVFAASGDTGLANGQIDYDNANDRMAFATAGSDRAFIDASGNFLVGGTSTNPTGQNVAGAAIDSSGEGNFSVDGAEALRLNRKQDGEILKVMAAGVTVGSIGSANGNLYLGQGDTTIMFSASADAILPKGTDGADRDGFVNLGQNINRFKDLYLSGGMNLARDIPSETEIERYNNTNTGGAKYKISFRQNSIQVGVIEVGTSSTNYITSSDYRLKENVVAMSGATERLKQLAPKRFNFTTTPDATVDGFLAHEVQDIVPETATLSIKALTKANLCLYL
jgi:hypothetical protein